MATSPVLRVTAFTARRIWQHRKLRIVDTGGIVPDDKAFIPSEIFRQARVALEESDAIVMVVDARTELASPDLELARLLQKLGKPLFLAVNKVDSTKQEAAAENFRTLGIRELYPISAEHGTGAAELLEGVLAVVPVVTDADDPDDEHKNRGERRPRQGSVRDRCQERRRNSCRSP